MTTRSGLSADRQRRSAAGASVLVGPGYAYSSASRKFWPSLAECST
ncbi:MAG TPA: hypothetical protein VHZ03_00835 [Trebonia sp.]|nr:hypothetical protein [Trebonia sp.]